MAAFVLIGSSCVRTSVETGLRGIAVMVRPDSVPLESTPDATRFSVNVIVRNDGTTPLYLGGACGPDAQEEIDGKWETMWSPVCISPSSSTIAPGDSLMFAFTAARFANSRVMPQLDSSATAGRYRLELASVLSGPLNYGLVSYPPQPPAKVLGTLRTPVFIIYSW